MSIISKTDIVKVESKVMRALKVIGSESYIPSNVVADIFTRTKAYPKGRHKNVLDKIRKEIEKMSKFGGQTFAHEIAKDFKESTYKSRGKNESNYLLSEDGFMMIAMSFNSEEGTMYRFVITKLFSKMRKTIIENNLKVEWNKENSEYMNLRIDGKKTRLDLTDTISTRIIPARMMAGKTVHGKIYKHYTDLANKIAGVELKKCVNTRDALTLKELETIKKIEDRITDLICKYATDDYEKNKDLYKKVKKELVG